MLESNEQYQNGRSSSRHVLRINTEEQQLIAFLESCDDEAARLRLRAVLLYIQGYPIYHVIAETGCSRSSLLSWCRAYKLHGANALYDRRQGGNNAKLTDEQIEDLSARLQGRTPREVLGQKTATRDGQLWTVEDLYHVVQQWYGVDYKSRTSYYNLLKKCVPETWRSE